MPGRPFDVQSTEADRRLFSVVWREKPYCRFLVVIGVSGDLRVKRHPQNNRRCIMFERR